jgi:hypothetical protein
MRLINVLAGLAFAANGAAVPPSPAPILAPAGQSWVYLPLVRSSACAGCNTFTAGLVFQRDTDNPVRPPGTHADKNLALRGYSASPGALKSFVTYNPGPADVPPQLATLFNPSRVPPFTGVYRVYNWTWAASPDAGTRASPVPFPDVTVLGLQTTPGEALRVPHSGYDIGGGMEVIILYADTDTLAMKFTRDDSVAPNGYLVHVDNIVTDPDLLALYNSLDGGARYVYHGPPDDTSDYNLPNLPEGKVFGTARSAEIRVAIVDSGAFMDPRSCRDWWITRPGHPNCP